MAGRSENWDAGLAKDLRDPRFARELTHPASAFSGDAELAGVEQRFELPLSSLPAGNYVLRVVASSGPTRAQRDVRFDVDHVRAPLP